MKCIKFYVEMYKVKTWIQSVQPLPETVKLTLLKRDSQVAMLRIGPLILKYIGYIRNNAVHSWNIALVFYCNNWSGSLRSLWCHTKWDVACLSFNNTKTTRPIQLKFSTKIADNISRSNKGLLMLCIVFIVIFIWISMMSLPESHRSCIFSIIRYLLP